MQPFKVAVERAYHHNNAHMLPQSKPLLTSKELKELARRRFEVHRIRGLLCRPSR
jgi:hypothetical protein